MGDKMRGYFARADQIGGLVARVRLASVARVTSTEAEILPDEPVLLSRLDEAMMQVQRQFSSPPPSEQYQPGVVAKAPSDAARTSLLRKHLSSCADLLAQRSLFLGDLDSTVQRINEAASGTLDIQRVSVWFLEDDDSSLRCADLFDRKTGEHSSGTTLFARDYAEYFAALRSERTIAAHDAHQDPRTSCFSGGYLSPLGIGALLDVPIWLGKKMVGVVCHEHVGQARTWDADEETFAYLMGSVVALALERDAASRTPTGGA